MTTITGGLRISGGFRIGSPTPPPSLFTPIGTQSSLNNGLAYFEMGDYNPFIDPTLVPDISGQNHGLYLNDNAAGNISYYHFFNNSAQAGNWDWPTADASAMTISGWFAFGSLAGNVSLVSRNEGSNGWALRVDSSGTVVNLVKYNDTDQTTTLNTPLTTNTWHFISVSQNGSTVEFVIDGTEYTITGSANAFISTGGPVRLQYDPYNGGNQNTELWMRDVKIFSANLGLTGLQSIYTAQKANYGY